MTSMSLKFAFAVAAPSLSLRQSHSHSHRRGLNVKALQCGPIEVEVEGVMCEPCNGTGWLLCDFCNGQKTNVRAQNNNRIYRRCPSCKAVGYVLCSKCKVFKCVTFPNFND